MNARLRYCNASWMSHGCPEPRMSTQKHKHDVQRSHSWIKHPAVSVQQTSECGETSSAEILMMLQLGLLSGALSTNCSYLTFRKDLLNFYTMNKYFIFFSMIHKQTFWRIFGGFAGLRPEMFPLLWGYRLTLSFHTMLFFVSDSRWYTRQALWFVSVCWHQVL